MLWAGLGRAAARSRSPSRQVGHRGRAGREGHAPTGLHGNQEGPPHSLVVHCRVQRAPNAPQLDRSKHQHPSPRPSGRPADPPGRSRALLAHCIAEDGPTCFGGACWLTDSPLLPATPAADPCTVLSFPAGGEASPSTFPASDRLSSQSMAQELGGEGGAEQTGGRGWVSCARVERRP